jgi:PLP dependent protein
MAVQTHKLLAESLRNHLQKNQNLLAVSKLQPLEKIIDLNQRGQIHFGENYVQEALDKVEQLVHLNLKWHLIGPLQKNKVKYLKNKFEYIHSVDSYELAELISKKSVEINHVQKIFLQVNFSNEISKSGFDEISATENWKKLATLSGIQIVGLMTMPPLQNNPEENRTYFKKCFDFGKKLNLNEFSMGTSHDYNVALDEGSTWIRLGTVLFGERILK